MTVHDLTVDLMTARIRELEEMISGCHCDTWRAELARWQRRLKDAIPTPDLPAQRDI